MTADRRRAPDWTVTALMSAVGILTALQGTILVPLVSVIPDVYGVGAVQASWIITVALLAGAVATPVVSRLADMYGKRRLLGVALLVMAAGSVLVAVTDEFAVAVVGRAMQGCSSALLPVAMSVLKETLPEARVGPGIALVSGTLGLGAAVGLPLAGLVYAGLGWSALFWLLAGLATVTAGAVRWALPRPPAAAADRFDLLGAVLLLAALVPLLLVIAQGGVWGWGSPAVGRLLLVSLVAFALWVPWELRCASPLVDLRLATRRGVVLTNAAALAVSVGMLANLIIASYQLGTPASVAGGFGLSPATTGLLMAVPTLVLLLASPVIGRLLGRFGGQPLLCAGALVMAVGYVARVHLDEAVWQVVLGSVVVGVGTSFAFAAMPMIIMSAVPPSRAASGNGINTLFRMLGTASSTAGIAALTAATSVTVGGAEFPTPQTYHLACWACAGAALVAAGLAWFVPRGAAAAAADPEGRPAAPGGHLVASRVRGYHAWSKYLFRRGRTAPRTDGRTRS